MKLTSVEVIKSGQGQKGPWTLVKCSVEGKTGSYTGFMYEKVYSAGEEVEMEFFQEEYNGKMQDKFKLVSAKKANATLAEMAIKMEIARYGQEILRKLDLIMEELKIRDFKAEIEAVRNQEPKKPTWEELPNNVADIGPDDVPF